MALRAWNESVANLLLIWAHLDNRDLWYGLLAAAPQKSTIAAKRTSKWLGEIAVSEVEFVTAVRMLQIYSLIKTRNDEIGQAMHQLVHQWVLHIQNDDQKKALSWLAIVLVGLAVPMVG